MYSKEFRLKHFIIVVLITSIWVNISEVFRYFVLVIPRVKNYWNHLEEVANMNWLIFGIWGVWDTILTAMTVVLFWLYAERFGNNLKSAFYSAVLAWIFFFVLYWMGVANMGYSDWSILWLTLPLSLFELVIANIIASSVYKRLEYERV